MTAALVGLKVSPTLPIDNHLPRKNRLFIIFSNFGWLMIWGIGMISGFATGCSISNQFQFCSIYPVMKDWMNWMNIKEFLINTSRTHTELKLF